MQPTLHLSFNIPAEITTAEINSPTGIFISSMTYESDNEMNYTFYSDAELEEGSYKIRINAKDEEGTYMNKEFILEFKLDDTEQALMDNSVKAVEGLIADLEKMGLL